MFKILVPCSFYIYSEHPVSGRARVLLRDPQEPDARYETGTSGHLSFQAHLSNTRPTSHCYCLPPNCQLPVLQLPLWFIIWHCGVPGPELRLSVGWGWYGTQSDRVRLSLQLPCICNRCFTVDELYLILCFSVFNLLSIKGITWNMIQASPDKNFWLIVYLRFNEYLNSKNYPLPYSKYLVNY